MHPPEAAICEAAWPIDPPGLEAEQHLLKWSSLPSSRLLRLPLSSARATAPRHACRKSPLIRVDCADAVVVVALPHACSDCACLPVVPDKLRP